MIDRARITIRAGNGGDGIVHFRRAKFQPKAGPDGGDGGKGGNFYIQADANLSTLDDYAHKQKFQAEDGQPGGGEVCSGAKGEHVTIKVPVGTLVKLTSDNGELRILDFDEDGMKVLVAKGGRGGRGNYQFRSSTNQTPQQSTPGEMAEIFEVEMDLKLLADVGLIGLPNAGKSTLLSVLSNARPKIANYPFTTLEPNLGVANVKGKKIVIADIPGLIEGASEGKGLGVQFLRHVERTKILVHVISVTLNSFQGRSDEEGSMLNQVQHDNIQIWKDYMTVRNELKKFGNGLDEKKEIVVVNKIDMVSEKEVAEILKTFKKKKIVVLPISCGTMTGIEELRGKIDLLR